MKLDALGTMVWMQCHTQVWFLVCCAKQWKYYVSSGCLLFHIMKLPIQSNIFLCNQLAARGISEFLWRLKTKLTSRLNNKKSHYPHTLLYSVVFFLLVRNSPHFRPVLISWLQVVCVIHLDKMSMSKTFGKYFLQFAVNWYKVNLILFYMCISEFVIYINTGFKTNVEFGHG